MPTEQLNSEPHSGTSSPRAFGSIGKSLRTIGPWVIIVVLAVSNALLINQNLRMRAEINKGKPDSLEPGNKVSPFVVTALRGGTINVNYTGEEAKRVFLFFSPGCQYCHEQFPYWREVLKSINGNRFQVIGLVSDSEDKAKVEDYLRSAGCESMPVAFLPSSIQQSYKLIFTPITIVVDNNGRVEKIWPGLWDNDTIASANSSLGLEISKR